MSVVWLGLVQQKTTVPARPLSHLLAKRQTADGSAGRIPSLPSFGSQTQPFHAEHKRPLTLRVRGNIHGGEESFCRSVSAQGLMEGQTFEAVAQTGMWI